MPSRYRKKPLAQLEHGTRIYAPSPSEARYRVVANDPVSGERIFAKCRTEEQARSKARELEQVIAQCATIRDSADAGPRTVERLAHRYIDDHLSGLSAAIPGKADLPAGPVGTARIGAWKVTAWTSADSSAVIASVRPARCSDALVQDVGAAMRALVTHARRLRWLTTHSEDPMCMVRYAKTASIQGAASVYVPRSTLPTDEQCAALFDTMVELGHRRWAAAQVPAGGGLLGEVDAVEQQLFVDRPVEVEAPSHRPGGGEDLVDVLGRDGVDAGHVATALRRAGTIAGSSRPGPATTRTSRPRSSSPQWSHVSTAVVRSPQVACTMVIGSLPAPMTHSSPHWRIVTSTGHSALPLSVST